MKLTYNTLQQAFNKCVVFEFTGLYHKEERDKRKVDFINKIIWSQPFHLYLDHRPVSSRFANWHLEEVGDAYVELRDR